MKALKLIASILLCEAIGVIGSFFTFPAIGAWYAALQKPFFSPPNWLFGPVWTILFALMGISLYLALEKGLTKKAIVFFGIQLILNLAWSILFFGFHSPMIAFAEIIFLWIAIAATILEFRKTSQKAAWLLTPYILWVSFAAILNYAVWALNP
ncbi:MAG: tryptophan-rich sensory protein [Candidatus ainarchaeum sp.]|nr:tryptophan-rich sensory protein [Candidatus ainarchaeum sp.]